MLADPFLSNYYLSNYNVPLYIILLKKTFYYENSIRCYGHDTELSKKKKNQNETSSACASNYTKSY